MQVVTSPDHADFILASGTECLGRADGPAEPVSLEAIRELLEQAAQRGGVPMLVANPDVVTVSGSGLVPMPGTFAKCAALCESADGLGLCAASSSLLAGGTLKWEER